MRPQHRQAGRQQRGGVGLVLADDHRGAAARGGGGHRLAQRPGRDDAAIAEAEGPVDDQQREVLLQRRVLQPVIHDDGLRPGRHRRPRPGAAIGRDPGRPLGRQQQRFVAHRLAVMRHRIHLHRPLQPAAIAAQQEMHGDAAIGQPLPEIERDGGLAGAARGRVAAADHRHRRPPAGLRHAPRRGRAIEGGDQGKAAGAASPEPSPPQNFRGAHQTRPACSEACIRSRPVLVPGAARPPRNAASARQA